MNHKKLIANIQEMIDLFEDEAVASPANTSKNCQHLLALYELKRVYQREMNKETTPKPEGHKKPVRKK